MLSRGHVETNVGHMTIRMAKSTNNVMGDNLIPTGSLDSPQLFRGTFHSTQCYSGNTGPPTPPLSVLLKNGQQPSKNTWHRVELCYSRVARTPHPHLCYPTNIRYRETFPS